ncbi:MAG: hypothetical protein H7Z11_00750 [Verrucomicrobia bacterium]|nr:hypothetical protein [Leptolyngbya sp. ES-bin-22]
MLKTRTATAADNATVNSDTLLVLAWLQLRSLAACHSRHQAPPQGWTEEAIESTGVTLMRIACCETLANLLEPHFSVLYILLSA